MNKFYHFGDSYATVGRNKEIKHFCAIISDHINFEYIYMARAGCSNEQILHILIENINKIKSGDIVFINFSFLTRGCWYDKKTKIFNSTNFLYDDINKKKLVSKVEEKEKVFSLINYYIDYTEDYARKIFKLFNLILNNLSTKNISIFYIHADDCEYIDELLDIGTNIKFTNGFSKWLYDNKFHLEHEQHYTKGIQPMLADVIIRKTNNLSNKENVYITIDDIDKTKIIKADKFI